MKTGVLNISSDPTESYIQGWLLGQVEVYCEQVRAGSKLVAEIGFHKRHLSLIKEHIEERYRKLKFILEERSEEFLTMYIYRYKYVSTLLQEHAALIDENKTNTILNVWLSGKLFGYSDYEIGQFIIDYRVGQNARGKKAE